MSDQFDPNSLNAVLARLEANTGSLTDQVRLLRDEQTQHFKKNEDRADRLEERVCSLEKCKARIVGYAAAVGTAGAGAGTWLKDLFTGSN